MFINAVGTIFTIFYDFFGSSQILNSIFIVPILCSLFGGIVKLLREMGTSL